jgi:UDP-N-acetylglucosamine 3-dehydrogenase
MVKIGLAGLGGWGKNHARVLFELGVLEAVCDLDPLKVGLYSKKYGVVGYTSFEEMLRESKLEGLVIATPTSTHRELAIKALRAGLHLLVEKPLASSYEEGLKIVEEAERNERVVGVGYIERFNPAVTFLKQMVDGKELGEPLLFEFVRENRWPERIKDVGIIYDTVVHDIDTARYLLAEEPMMVFSRFGYVRGKMEDIALLILEFPKRQLASMIANWITPKKERRLRAVFSEGVVEIDFITQEVRIEDANGTKIPRRRWEEPLMLEDKAFVESVKEGKPFLISARDALGNNKVAEAALLSEKRAVPVYLPR